MSWIWIVLISVAGAVVLIAVLRVVLRGLARNRVADADELLAGERVVMREPSANLFGLQSQGMGQVRGNGVLTLTETCLHFLMWLPKREVSIDLRTIRSIETPKSFLGKSKFRPLLKVDFTDERGQQDAAAWLVADLEAWKDAVEERARL